MKQKQKKKITNEKNHHTKRWFFEKLNKIDRTLAQLTKRKRRPKLTESKMNRETLQQAKKKRTEIIIWGYFKNLYLLSQKI